MLKLGEGGQASHLGLGIETSPTLRVTSEEKRMADTCKAVELEV